MKIVNILLLIFVSIKCYSQCINYYYDQAGNRISRNICPQPLVVPGGSGLHQQDKSIVQSQKADLKIFPNPTSDVIEIRSADISPKAGVQIFNLLGQKMYEGRLSSNRISLVGWQAGRYFVRVSDGDRVKIVAIMKE